MTLLLFLKPSSNAGMIPAPSGCYRKDPQVEFELAQKRKKAKEQRIADEKLIKSIIEKLLEGEIDEIDD